MAQPLVSVVIPGLNEAPNLPRLHEELCRVCDPLPYRFEWVFVDDGSSDGTPDVLAQLRRGDERVRYVLLSRNFGKEAALSAGLAYADGDAVILMDSDLQHPPALIPKMLQLWQAGHEIVNTIRLEIENISPLKRLTSWLFYRAFNWLAATPIPPGSNDFRLLGRAAVDVLKDLPERQLFLRGLVPWIGFSQTSVEFTAPPRHAGQTKYTFLRSIRLALDSITSFSFYPLRRLAVFGGLVSGASLLYAAWLLVTGLVRGVPVDTGAVILASVLFFGGCQLLTLGVVGEYVGRVLEQVKGRPTYIIRSAVGPSPRRAGEAPPDNHVAASPAEKAN
ncbi:MAG TPA: glycosyltransferase family 2 protein [Gemmataceae bacterium]|nr:glycosyltransferase family 2 protein [Gemmataceae bacterium]